MRRFFYTPPAGTFLPSRNDAALPQNKRKQINLLPSRCLAVIASQSDLVGNQQKLLIFSVRVCNVYGRPVVCVGNIHAKISDTVIPFAVISYNDRAAVRFGNDNITPVIHLQ